MNGEILYENVVQQIYDDIYNGVYADGERIPSERELAEKIGVSRVTVRKSMELLEERGIIIREVGRGTRLSFQNKGHNVDLDTIVLIAPAKNNFFTKFIAALQEYAETKDSLVLYVEKPKKETLEHCLYKLFKKGLRNAVIWLEDIIPNQEKLQILRTIGMNMVFFDSNQGLPYADCVTLDNSQAVQGIYCYLREKGKTEIKYIGWDNKAIYSVVERERAYRYVNKEVIDILSLPWKQKEMSREALIRYIQQFEGNDSVGIICGDREIGVLLKQIIYSGYDDVLVGTVDVTYKQDLEKTVQKIYECMETQCENGKSWISALYEIEGFIDKKQVFKTE